MERKKETAAALGGNLGGCGGSIINILE